MSQVPSPILLRRPVCSALVICDAAHRDPVTRKAYLLGSFNSLVSPRFPFHAPPCVVHYAIGDGQGDYEIKVVVEEESTDLLMVTLTKQKLRMTSPLQTIEEEVPVPSIPYKRPGRYWFKLYANDAMIGQRAILVQFPGRKPKSGAL